MNSNLRIIDASPSAAALTGYSIDDIVGLLLKDLIHPDDCGVFVAEFNEAISHGSPLRLFYRIKKKDGTYSTFETVGRPHIASPRFAKAPRNQSAFCQAVFIMSRLYPARNTALLDSFLEHKMENERLRRRIAELRQEEADELREAQRHAAAAGPGGPV